MVHRRHGELRLSIPGPWYGRLKRKQIWDLFEGGPLFFARKDGVLNDEQHLAEMVSLLGKPPQQFLKRSSKCAQYWDAQGMVPLLFLTPRALPHSSAGNWIASTPIPEQSFEARETRLVGEDKDLLLAFVRCALCWLLEARPTAEELAYDDFLMQASFARRGQQ